MFLNSINRKGHNFLAVRRLWYRHLNTTGNTRGNLATTVGKREMAVDQDISNITLRIAEKVDRNLHLQRGHPLNTIKSMIEGHFKQVSAANPKYQFECIDNLPPMVTTKQCFDELLTPPDHVSRKLSDTYYIDKDHVLRTHTSAHQTELMRMGKDAFLCTGDVYRRDEIDSSHYPVFHQMEGVKIFDPSELPSPSNPSSDESIEYVQQDLKMHLEGMVKAIFGDVEMRWVDAYFPFTDPSLELEVYFQGDWLEVLGSGVIQRKILGNCDLNHTNGWAFGLGLERLAMVLFDIPDIRLFWSDDPRFIEQFRPGEVTKFVPYSKYPPCYKDVSFWKPEGFHENDLCDLVGSVAGDLVETVELIDNFTHPKTNKVSLCYRINFRSMDRNLTNAEVDDLQSQIRGEMVDSLGCELR